MEKNKRDYTKICLEPGIKLSIQNKNVIMKKIIGVLYLIIWTNGLIAQNGKLIEKNNRGISR